MVQSERAIRKRSSSVSPEQEERLRELFEEFQDRLPLADAVYSALSKAVTLNVLPQGSRITGASLAGILGVSRTPIRDALRKLESERLIVSTAGSGAVVVPLSVEDIDEIYTLRVALEGCAASLAARNRTQADLSLLETVHQAFADAVAAGEADQIDHLNSRFHAGVIQTAKSARLTEFVVLLQNSVRRLGPTTLTSPERAHQSVQEHAELLQAIRNSDSALAEAIARGHMEEARVERLRQFHQNFLVSSSP